MAMKRSDAEEPDVPSYRTTLGFVLFMLAAFIIGWFGMLELLEVRR